ncbi:sensor histidine kinase [Cesiribacter sp. SM1]|uniref:sensor histidine kinase n=1 Tax=Cesiribacter sp. SM1 TaxID=2861196 RepID=UPI001CD4C0DB|nr:histidine kinase [Cesiribacter sp. SM1]
MNAIINIGLREKKRLLRTYSIIVAIVVVGFVVRLYVLPELSLPFHLLMALTSLVLVVLLWESFYGINKLLNRLLPYERSMSLRIVVQMLLGIAVALFVRYILKVFGEPYVPFKIEGFFKLSTYVLYIFAAVALNLGFVADYFIGRWKDSIRLAERLEREKTQVQFDNLKNQLNPHFLFNALSSLNSLIYEDQALASQFLQQLSKVYRYLLQHQATGQVSLATELEFIANYTNLLQTRFGDGLRFNFDIRKDDLEMGVVPVSLQVLIENAIKHNVLNKANPLTITIETASGYLCVCNNLQPKNIIDASNRQGLQNLRSLYAYLSAKPMRVEETSTSFTVKLPLL